MEIRISHAEQRQRFVAYVIHIRTEQKTWTVEHRYSEFLKLDQALRKIGQVPCSLPPKLLLPSAAHLEERERALELYLESILYAKDPRFRQNQAWNLFLCVPGANGQSAAGNTFNGNAGSAGSTLGNPFVGGGTAGDAASSNVLKGPAAVAISDWIAEYDSLRNYMLEVRAMLSRRDPDAASRAAQRTSAHKALRLARTKITQLEAFLSDLTNGLSRAECLRREDLLANVKSTIAQIEAETRDSALAPHGDSNERKELLSVQPSSRRKFGATFETEQTRPLDSQGLVQLQDSMMREQDAQLLLLHSTVKRQKEIAHAMAQELDDQNRILEDIDRDLSRVGANVKYQDRKVNNILK